MTRTNPTIEIAPSNKFYPPLIDNCRYLLRTELLTKRLHSALKSARVIVIEAQAGQGKSVLASQILNHNQLHHLWYQIGPEDSDPFFILASIIFNLKEKYPEFVGIELETILNRGKVGPLDIHRCANMLLREIDTRLSSELFIVFDDVHLLSDHGLAKSLIHHLLDTSPPRLRFILTSRYPLLLKSKVLRSRNAVCRLVTDDLAFSQSEIEEYFAAVLKCEIDRETVQEIHRTTGGWAMGVILAGDSCEQNRPHSGIPPLATSTSRQEQTFDFFRHEILPLVSEDLRPSFGKFSFLTEIPVDLARVLSGRDDIESVLDDMVYRNLFVYRQKRDPQTFFLHQSYRDFLQQRAMLTFSHDEVEDIRSNAAAFYCEQGMIDKAIICYVQIEDYEKIDSLLATRGDELFNRNSTINILSSLESLPEANILQHPWMALYIGLMRADFIPHSTLPLFEAARTGFNATGESGGESVSLAMIIYYHIVVSGDYRAGADLLPRLDTLLADKQTSLPYSLRCLAARYLAFGYFLFDGNTKKALTCFALPGNPHGTIQRPSSIAHCRFIRGYIELFTGSRTAFLREAEACFALLSNPLVGMSDKLMIRILFLGHLSMNGDYLNFTAEKQAIEQAIRPEILERTVASSNISAWESSNLFATGKTAEALELLENSVTSGLQNGYPHMRSHLLQWKAFGHALLGQSDASLSCLKESIELREQAGGVIHLAFNSIIAGAVYSRLGCADLAESFFERGIDTAKTIPSTYFLVCAYLNRSHHKLISSDRDAALDDLRTGLVLMRMHDLDHFWSWEPVMMGRLLSLALQEDIEKDFVRALAQKRLDICLEDSGQALPQLHFSLLDNFHIAIGSRTVLQVSDFSPSHRELLGILLSTKDQKINQEQVQLAIWPDSTPTNARRSFDTLTNRLRHRLGDALPVSAKRYLVLKKGILELQNSQTDAVQFLTLAKIGLRHARSREWWQAGNVFLHAFSYVKGLWPEDTFCSEKAVSFNSQIISSLSKATIAWAGIMHRSGDIDGAIDLVEKVLHFHFEDEQLISLLYSLYQKRHNRLKAREILERYRAALKRQEYPAEEIEDLQQEIINFSLIKLAEEED